MHLHSIEHFCHLTPSSRVPLHSAAPPSRSLTLGADRAHLQFVVILSTAARASEEGTKMSDAKEEAIKTRNLEPVDVHLDVVLSVLAGGGSRSGPAVSNLLKQAGPH